MAGGLDEPPELAVGDRVNIDRERPGGDRPNRALFGIVVIRPHRERTAREPHLGVVR